MSDLKTLQYYNQNASEYAELTSRRSMESAIDRFSAFLPTAGSIVDIGCGGGRDLKVFYKRGFNAVGLDVSVGLGQIAAGFSGCPVVIADVRNMPFASGSFNAAWAAASLLHLLRDDIPAALTEIRRVLRPNAYFFSSIKVGEGEQRDPEGRLFTYYAPEEWNDAQKQCGFRLVESTGSTNGPDEFGHQWFNSISKTP